jgi:hypothetical protein
MTTRLPSGSEQWRLAPDWPGQRCGAKTRSGTPCKNPIVTGRKRCRMHGGAAGSGAPTGKRHGNYRHGRFSKEYLAAARRGREQLRLVARLGEILGMFD